MRTSDISWKMIMYINLDDVIGVSEGLQREINRSCNATKFHIHVVLVENNSQKETRKINKIKQSKFHIHELLIGSRMKRAPLEFIGQLSKVLFGTLTAEDFYYINNVIEHVENKTNDLATLLINQIATRLRFGELYNMTLKIKTQLADLRQYIDEKYKNVTDIIIRNKINDDIERVIEDINIAILEHEIDLNILIDGILFEQGLIHPRIISPQYLIKNSKHIQEQIPYAEFPVALNKEGIDRLIKISTLHVAYLQDRLVYILQIPC
ncbi:hypothetical protein P5V15_010258 [Pogonomyrmex californicus]